MKGDKVHVQSKVIYSDLYPRHAVYERSVTAIHLHDQKEFCDFLWHVFSYEKKECLQEKEVDAAFNEEVKESCYVFY